MTKIQWTNETWNPVTGCTKVSQGCKHCYAERDFPRVYAKTGRKFVDIALHPDRLEKPMRWTKPRMIFVNSMSDLFHEDVPDEFIDQVFAVMALCAQHTFQVLTKRPERMRRYATDAHRKNRGIVHNSGVKQFGRVVTDELLAAIDSGFPNVWLGVSVENQATADERIPLLLETPAAVRWASYEPALGPIEFREQWMHKQGCPSLSDWAGGLLPCSCASRRDALSAVEFPRLDWIVVGGESGPGARPFDVAWARSTVEQCKAAGVPVFYKQGGRSNRCAHDSKGGCWDCMPDDLKVREFPNATRP